MDDIQAFAFPHLESTGPVIRAGDLAQAVPDLHLRLQQQKRLLWQQWQGQASLMVSESGRSELHGLLSRGWIGPKPPPNSANT